MSVRSNRNGLCSRMSYFDLNTFSYNYILLPMSTYLLMDMSVLSICLFLFCFVFVFVLSLFLLCLYFVYVYMWGVCC